MALQKELAESIAELTENQAATNALLSALVATHPRPDLLLEGYLQHMDTVADNKSPERIEKYRQAMQPWKDALLDCANQRRQQP